MAAAIDLQERENFTRLAGLLVDKGTEALRNGFDTIHLPVNLSAVLAANQKSLSKLKYRIINKSQWDLLYPPSGTPPDSKTFDVSLLTVLFRNICGLPSTGWDAVPLDTDRSLQANIIRIKTFRNEVYAHVTSTRLDDATFESLWIKIAEALVELNIPQEDIDELRESPLSLKEVNLMEVLRNWKLIDEELQKLAKHNFESTIKNKVKYFLPGTREWLLKDVEDWFNGKEEETRILLLQAGPGFGKSVFAAKICEIFKKSRKLAACHFCNFSDANLRNPMMMLQSLASQMCENVPDFKEKLLDQLKRPHEIPTIKEAFRIYLQNPLDELEAEPRLVVIDGLDESAADDRSEIVSLIAECFSELPDCIKFLITSRPEISIAKLNDIPKINIGNDHHKNNSDIEIYLKFCLPNLEVSKRLVMMCEGSFLYAFYAQNELKKRDDLAKMTLDEIVEFLPKGMSSVYYTYFKRLETELKLLNTGNLDVLKFFEILVAAEGPLPLTFVAKALGLAPDCRETKRIINKVNEAMSCLLYVADGSVTIFHKSVIDWLLAQGYEDHEYVVNFSDGNKSLWLICEQTFEGIKNSINSEYDQNVTVSERYALSSGFYHLLQCNLQECFYWLTDMVIVFAILLHQNYDDEAITVDYLQNLWVHVLHVNGVISDQIRARISWQILELQYLMMSKHSFPGQLHWIYLEEILTHSPNGCFTNDEKEVAQSLLSNVSLLAYNKNPDFKTDVDVMPLGFWDERDTIKGLDLSKDKTMAAVASGNGTIFLVSVPSLNELWKWKTDRNVPCCTFSPDDSFLLFGKLDTALHIKTKKEVPFFFGKRETFVTCAFSPNGKRLITSNGTRIIKLWDIAKHCLMAKLCSGVPVNCCSFDITGLFVMAYNNYELDDSASDVTSDDFASDDSASDDSASYSASDWEENLSMNSSDLEVLNKEVGDENSSTNSLELNVPDEKYTPGNASILFAKNYSDIERDHDSFSAWNTLTLQRCDKRNFQDIKNGDTSYSKVCRRCFRPGSGTPPTYKICKCTESSERYRRLQPCGHGISSGIYNDIECFFALGKHSFSIIENTHFTRLAVFSCSIPDLADCIHDTSDDEFVRRKKVFRIDNDRWLYKNDHQLVVLKTSEPIPPTTVYNSSFSPDSSRLATCTSDGCINIWNVETKQVEQRLIANRGEEPFFGWWSKTFLYVFEFFDRFPSLKQYPVDINSNILFTESQQISLAHLLNEFVSVSQVIDFSAGLLCLNCEEKKPLKILDVSGSGGPQFITLPHIQPIMNVTISPDSSYIFSNGDDVDYIWKRNSANPVLYDVIFALHLQGEQQKMAHSPVLSCFSNNSEILVIFDDLDDESYSAATFIDLEIGDRNQVMLNREFFSSDRFCIRKSRIIITTKSNRIDFHDMNSGARIWSWFQPNLTNESRRMKLSPDDTVLAFPKLNGNMEFLRLSIPEGSSLRELKDKAAAEWRKEISNFLN